MPAVDLSSQIIARLQKHAVPLVDTFDSVIAKILDAYEGQGKKGDPLPAKGGGIQIFDPAAPPNLLHTVVKFIKFSGRVFHPAETYWNTLMHAAIRKVAERGITPEELTNYVLANNVVGEKDTDGYKVLSDVGISVQGQDANGAWKTIYHLASKFDLPLEVTFVWKNNDKAIHPGVTGSFTV